MLSAFQQNLGNLIVLSAVIAAVGLAIRSLVNDRKNGKSGCGQGCQGCSIEGLCHSEKGKNRLLEAWRRDHPSSLPR